MPTTTSPTGMPLIQDDIQAGVKPDTQPGELPTPGKIRRLWEEGLMRRRILDQEAWVNIAFIAGQQYAVFDSTTKRFYIPDYRQDRSVRMKVNLCLDFWRSEVSTLLESKPIPQVLPVTAEDTDRKIAQVANRILEHELKRVVFDVKRYESAMWTTAAGMSYLYVYWNQEIGPPSPITGQPRGEICLDVVPHFEVVQDPAANFTLDEANWVIHGKVLTNDQAFEMFGQNFADDNTMQNQIPFSWSHLFGGGMSGVARPKKGVLMLRMWHRPSRKYPQGFVLTIVGNKVIEQQVPYPYDHNQLPFVDFHHIRIPGRFEGQSTLVSLIPIQKDYNQSRSRQAELRKFLTAPKILAAKGQLDADRITGLPGEVIEYNPVGPNKPEWQAFPVIPNFIFQTAQTAFQEMQDISGQHDVSRGALPAAGTSGAAVLALQEKDERKIATTVMQHEQAISRAGKLILDTAKQYWDVPRSLQTWDEETGSMGVQMFRGADIDGQYQVTIQPGSSFPKSQAQKAQDILNLWDRRVITDPRFVIKQLDLPSTDDIMESLDLDSRQAHREHDRIFKANPVDMPIAEAWHNHQVHIQEHNDFRKMEDFEQWPPALKAILAEHIQQHQEYEAEAQAQQAALQSGMAPGAPPPVGGPGMPKIPADLTPHEAIDNSHYLTTGTGNPAIRGLAKAAG